METATHVFFYGHTPQEHGFHVFSQWYPAKFTETINDLTTQYYNAEQYMMAHKAMLFGDDKLLKKILFTTSPGLAKKYGRQIEYFDPKVWNEHKFNIVVRANKLKFGQNIDLLEKLLSTKNKRLVEASPLDKIWGCGLSAQVASKTSENKWPGQNLLGKALVEVRESFK